MTIHNKIAKLFSAFLLICLPLYSFAAWNVSTSAQLQSGYEDNIRLSSTDKDDAIVTTATGQLQVSQRTETSGIDATGGITFLKYSATDQLNNQDVQFFNANAYKRTENINWGLRASLRRDYVLRTAQQLIDADGALEQDDISSDIDELELAEAPDLDNSSNDSEIRRENFRISPSVSWNLSERNSTTLRFNYSTRSYGKDATLFGLSDNTNKRVSLDFKRRVSENNAVSLRASASFFDPEQSANSENYELRAIWDYRYSERSRIGAQVGFRRSERDLLNAEDTTGFIFRLTGDRQYERTRLRGSLERSVFPSSFGDLVETNRLTLNLTRLVSEKAVFGLSLRAYQTDSDAEFGRSDDRISINPALNYSLTPTWNLRFAYGYTWVDRKRNNTPAIQGSASGNSVSLAIFYSPPRSN